MTSIQSLVGALVWAFSGHCETSRRFVDSSSPQSAGAGGQGAGSTGAGGWCRGPGGTGPGAGPRNPGGWPGAGCSPRPRDQT